MPPRGQKTYSLDRFGGGVDLRDRVFGRRDHTLKQGRNVWIGNDEYVYMRPPVGQATAAFSSQTQGLLELGSELYTIAPSSAGLADTTFTIDLDEDLSREVKVLEFDTPSHMGSSWTLLQVGQYNGDACALIQHGSQGSVGFPVLLHVWDENRPAGHFTYVMDEGVPTHVYPDPALGQSGTRAAGAVNSLETLDTWVPRMGVAGGKLWISLPDGRVKFCKTDNARAWNTKTANEILDDGEIYYLFLDAHVPGSTSSTVQVPIAYDDLVPPSDDLSDYRYWCYVLEYHDGTGWRPFTEVSGSPSSDLEYAISSAGSDRTNVEVMYNGVTIVDTLGPVNMVRFRAIGRNTQDGDPSDSAASNWELEYSNVATYPSASGDQFYYLNHATTYPQLATGTVDATSLTTTASTPSNGEQRYRYVIYDRTSNSGSHVDIMQDDGWFTQYVVAMTERAGDSDAGFLAPQATMDLTGQALGFSQIRSRIAIHYVDGTVVYQVDQNPANMALIDFTQIGIGQDQASIQPVTIESSSVIPTSNGIRALYLDRFNSDSLRDTNIGEKIHRKGMPKQVAATYWAKMGLYIAIMNSEEHGIEFWVLSHSRENKIVAWSFWDSSLLTVEPDAYSLHAIGEHLFFRADDRLWAFDAREYDYANPVGTTPATQAFQDAGTTAITAEVELQLDDLGQPATLKRLTMLDLQQKGASTYGMAPLPFNRDRQLSYGTLSGTTVGKTRKPLGGTWAGVALRLTSTDSTGWELYGIQISYRPLRR